MARTVPPRSCSRHLQERKSGVAILDDTFRFVRTGSLPLLAIVLFAILLLILVPLLILGIAGAAFSRLGLSWTAAVTVIILMLIGYFVNIPVVTLKNAGNMVGVGQNTVFDAFSGEPVDDGTSSTTIALNLGGFFIPLFVAGYLLFETGNISGTPLLMPLAICIPVVTAIVIALTRIHPPSGISTPLVIPALAAIVCGVLLNGGTGLEAAVTAFAGGILGILLGAAAASLVKGRGVGVRRINIGGAGMFGALFLCALLSALIA